MQKTKKAFSIVELAIAMAFISSLMLGIGVFTIRIAQMYQKGLTLKSINDTGRELIDDITASITASNYNESWWSNKRSDSNTEKGSFRTYKEAISLRGGNESVPLFGAFCTGEYSYFWNSGYSIHNVKYNPEGDVRPIKYEKEGTIIKKEDMPGGTEIRLLKIPDNGRDICKDDVFPVSYATDSNPIILKVPQNTVELITESEDNLAIYDLTIFQPTFHTFTSQAFVSGTFILGTVTNKQDDISITATRDICAGKPGDNFNTDFSYCSVNKFNFAARAMAQKKP